MNNIQIGSIVLLAAKVLQIITNAVDNTYESKEVLVERAVGNMQGYIYKDGRILKNITQEILNNFPNVVLEKDVYNDCTDEFNECINVIYERVQPKIKKKQEFESLIKSYEQEVKRLAEDISQTLENFGLDKNLLLQARPEIAEEIGIEKMEE